MKRSKGITLIALVITIIVLLILAGVSILLVLGDNGILTQATNAVDKHRVGTAEEEVEMAWAGAESDYWSEWANNSGFTKDASFYDTKLKSYLSSTGYNISVTDGEEEGTYEVKYTSNDQNQPYTFIMDGNGKATAVGKGNAAEIASDSSNIGKGNAAEIASDSSNIGKAVNYKKTYTGSGSGWQILYADSSNVYIITTGSLTASTLKTPATGSTYSGTSDFSDLTKFPAVRDGWLNKIYGTTWTSSNPNMKATEYLLDSTVTTWSGLANDYAKWVIGGPTLELLVASYNAVNTSSPVTIGDLNTNGYAETISSGLTNTGSRPWNHGTHYWLACPSSSSENYVRFVIADNALVSYGNYRCSYAFRPVVCLKSSVQLTWNATTSQFDLDTAN